MLAVVSGQRIARVAAVRSKRAPDQDTLPGDAHIEPDAGHPTGVTLGRPGGGAETACELFRRNDEQACSGSDVAA